MKKSQLNSTNDARQRWILMLFVLIFLFKGIFYAADLTPLRVGASPDDAGHISYVMYLASEHERPILREAKAEKTVEENYNVSEEDAMHYENFIVNTDTYEEGEDMNYIAQHPPLYYLYLLPFYKITTLFTAQLSDIILMLRLATIPLGIITILAIYQSLKLLGLSSLAVNSAMVCVVFSPAIQFYLTMINNDAMLIGLSAAAFFCFAKFIKEDAAKYLYFFAALCGGITITKYTGAVVLPLYACAYIYYSLHIKKMKWKPFVRQALICLAIFAVIVVPILVQNYLHNGALFPLSTVPRPNYDCSLLDFVRHSGYFDQIFKNIICIMGFRPIVESGFFMQVAVSIIVGYLYFLQTRQDSVLWLMPYFAAWILTSVMDIKYAAAFSICALLGIFVLAMTQQQENKNPFDRNMQRFSVVMIVFFVLVFFRQQYVFYIHYGILRAMHGRYYYPLIIPFFYLLFRNLDVYSDRYTKYVPAALLGVNIILELSMMQQIYLVW